MTMDELRSLLELIEVQVKVCMCEYNDEECGDIVEELDYLVANFLKKFCDDAKKNVDVEELDVAITEPN